MKYLLDTHVALWALDDKSMLSKAAQSIMDNSAIPLFISIASAWEIAVKISIGKLGFNGGSEIFLKKMHQSGVKLLNIKSSHIKQVEQLPFHHRDPFDRLIIATALDEDLTIITTDADIQKYNIKWVW